MAKNIFPSPLFSFIPSPRPIDSMITFRVIHVSNREMKHWLEFSAYNKVIYYCICIYIYRSIHLCLLIVNRSWRKSVWSSTYSNTSAWRTTMPSSEGLLIPTLDGFKNPAKQYGRGSPPFFCIRVSYVYYPYICLYVDIILLMIYIICFIHTQQIIYMYITGVGEPGFSYTFHPWIFTTFHHQLHGLRSRFPRRHVTALAFRRRGRGLEGGWFMACLPEVSLFAPEKWPKPNRKGGSSSSPTIFQGASC